MTKDQLSFDLPQRPAMEREAFFVASSNVEAVRFIDNDAHWPGGKLLLLGPAGAGKTHLAHVWAALSGAEVISAPRLIDADIPAIVRSPVVVEDAHLLAPNPAAEAAFFHLYNLLSAESQPLLITARRPVAAWGLRLRDLLSRLSSVTAAHLKDPDDALLGAVLVKQFADRQLRPTPDTISYLVRRIDRSFAAISDIVERLDQAALTSGRPITRALAREIVAVRQGQSSTISD